MIYKKWKINLENKTIERLNLGVPKFANFWNFDNFPN